MLSARLFPLVLALSVGIVKASTGDVWFYESEWRNLHIPYRQISLTLCLDERCDGAWIEPRKSYIGNHLINWTTFGSMWIDGYHNSDEAPEKAKGCMYLHTEPDGGGDHAQWTCANMGQYSLVHTFFLDRNLD